ncbi:zinc finger protein Xfin-like [Mercenaria mercenaria]|uniref:zinc finger protein Xfin-like n=1 Tax=Mercenaria mercenaria TaxID=6596 RepID=UPI00234F65A1|nr:zinc finger protein Xfin-like [Mercenaria mercenaria]
MAAAGESEVAVVKDLDSLAVQFGQSLMESDLKAYNGESSDTGNYEIKLENAEDEDTAMESSPRTDFRNLNFSESVTEVKKEENDVSFDKSQQSSSKQKVYRCEDCGQCYLKSSSFSNHRLAHHPSVCTHCGRRFSLPSSLEAHLQLECGRKKESSGLECHICHKIMSTKKILNRHLRLHSNSGNFSCHLCSKSFGLKSSLEFHMRTHDVTKPYKCNACHTTFTEKSTAIRHVKKQHTEINYNSYIENTLQPANPVELANKINVKLLGGTRNDFSQSLLNSSEKPAKDVKSSSPSLKSLLEQPMVKMLESESILGKKVEESIKNSGECNDKVKVEGDMYGGYENDVVESDEEDLDNSTHQGDYFKVYNCKLCDKSYHHSSSLNKHMKKHDSSKFVTCYICKKVCVNEEDFQIHFTLHSSTKTYICPLCGAKIARRSSVLRHIRKTHKYSNQAARDLLNQHLASLDVSETVKSESETGHEDSIDEEIKPDTEIKPEIAKPKTVVDDKKEVNEVEEFEHFTCSVCEQIFLENAKLTMHLLTVHKLSEEEALVSSGLRINDNENKADRPDHYTCSLCQQIFLEKTEWKKHLCDLHGLSNEEAVTCIQLETGEHGQLNESSLTDTRSGISEKNEIRSTIFDTPLSVTVEKDKEGVQKVIKVMPEVPVGTQLAQK